ncbi:Transcriptional regulatory protein SIN3 [Smittium culicis]|uniref:Transcriptional regulatory protein SIN3 n=1 Tax=Smittium culicis TaxID=133412 RepID=A0A1R1XE49_9FUNG|nr:Transcriptional regulatory protein SIN3 [Smittium culicis]OMJ17329.1 Transcriptional regulatory protein SIN3 [Smittium culicis]
MKRSYSNAFQESNYPVHSNQQISSHNPFLDSESLQFLIIKFCNSLKKLFSENKFLYSDVSSILSQLANNAPKVQEYFLKIIYSYPNLCSDFKSILIKISEKYQITNDDLVAPLSSFLFDDCFGEIPITFTLPEINSPFFKKLLFAQIYKTINNKAVYNEFLSLVNLYNQDLITPSTFITSSIPFLKNRSDILDSLKKLVLIAQTTVYPETPGPSYRFIGSSYNQSSNLKESEDPIQELNDSWMSHPTWASERNEFVHHKKNQYEEAMFRVEEERHQLQIDIETNKQLINQLTPIVKKIQKMSEIDKENLTLPFRFGGNSIALPRRALKNVYDAQRSVEVLEALHTHPAVAAPLVLRRLEQKDKEWRKLKDDLSKGWKDVEIKNYYRSLEHRSTSIKSQDRKINSPKYLINEIQAARHESGQFSLFKPHLKFKFDNIGIISDVLNVLSVHFKKYPSLMPLHLRKPAKTFLLSLFMKLVGLKQSDLDLNWLKTFDYPEKTDSDRNESQASTLPKKIVSVVITPNKTPFHPKNASKKNIITPKRYRIHTSLAHLSNNLLPNTEPFTKPKSIKCFFNDFNSDLENRLNNFLYCDSFIYLFTRVFVFIYSRFETIYSASTKFQPLKSGCIDSLPNFPSVLSFLDLRGMSYYEIFISLLKKLVFGSIDSATYEDAMRSIFRSESYISISLDKQISNLAKHFSSILTSPCSISLLDLFDSKQLNFPIKSNEIASYCIQANSILDNYPEGNFFSISCSNSSKFIYFQLISPQDISELSYGKISSTISDPWIDYLLEYSSHESLFAKQSSQAAKAKLQNLMLNRNIRINSKFDNPEISIFGPLIVHFKENSYKINYKSDSFEYFVNNSRLSLNYKLSKKSPLSKKSNVNWAHNLESKLSPKARLDKWWS